ncbi:PHP domain-containing protein [Nocardioides sp. BGMRC 2183]|nr:PHP domain-containing protein [Nocardioides sp. BGMRC 2183]
MQIDLHTHSSVSDGTSAPAELVRSAAGAGLDVIALTDHDTTAGWAEAAAAADAHGVVVAPGIEISTRHRGAGVHLLAYLPDPTSPLLVAELDRIVAGRELRVPAMLARLRDLGIPATEEALAEVSGAAVVTGRPHVADLLVRLGVVADRDAAFAGYLAEGGPAFVDRYAADLTAAIGLVGAAGGVPVLAHPWGRESRRVLDTPTLAELADAGLVGLEVDHLDHGPTERAELRRIAADLGLLVTGASDHHGTGKTGHDLGCETTAPEVWEALRQRARDNGSPLAPFGPG